MFSGNLQNDNIIQGSSYASFSADQVDAIQRSFISKVYGWMFLGLVITAVAAWSVFDSDLYLSLISSSYIMWGLIIAEFACVIALSAAIRKISASVAALLFLLYALLNGVTLSTVFASFSSQSIAETFLVTSVSFGALSLYGYVTKRNLSRLGSFLFIGLIGVVLCFVLNAFISLPALSFAAMLIGIFVFAGLTVYDTQKLKEMSVVQLEDGSFSQNVAIIGALTLYLDFINLFLLLLRIFGGDRD